MIYQIYATSKSLFKGPGESVIHHRSKVAAAHNGKDLGIYSEIVFVQSVLLSKMFVFVLPLPSTDFEIQRQIDILQRGGTVLKETRAYDSKLG